MNTLTAQRINASLSIMVTLGTVALLTAPQRLSDWTRTTRHRGDVVGWVILAAGAATIAIMIIAYVQAKAQEYLQRIQ
ncbi:hypothetical protein [Nocardia sp. IFM 10818]